MSSSSDSSFDLFDLPLLPRKLVVRNMKPATIVALHSEPAIQSCLPIDSTAIIIINCVEGSVSIKVCSRNGLESIFGYTIDKDSFFREARQHKFRMENPQYKVKFEVFERSRYKYKIDAELMKKIWPSLTLRSVYIRGGASFIYSQLTAVTSILSELGLDKCENLTILPIYNKTFIYGHDLSYLFKILKFKKVKMGINLLGLLPPTIPPSADWNFSTSESLEQQDIERLMMTANSLVLPSSKICDFSCNDFCKKWLQNELKIKFMKARVYGILYDSSNPTRLVLDGIQNVRVENGWIIEREDGKKARIDRSYSYFYFKVL